MNNQVLGHSRTQAIEDAGAPQARGQVQPPPRLVVRGVAFDAVGVGVVAPLVDVHHHYSVELGVDAFDPVGGHRQQLATRDLPLANAQLSRLWLGGAFASSRPLCTPAVKLVSKL